MYQQIRAFFDRRDILEVDTPQLLDTTNPDVNIESIVVTRGERTSYLQTSPEFAMKRLLASGIGSIYQICHAFRLGEAGGRHNPEFAMLEWYRVRFDYQQLMDEIEALITELAGAVEFGRISYAQLFARHLEIDISVISIEDLRQHCAQQVTGCDSSSFSFDQCLDLLLGIKIEPEMRGYQFVYDYPVSQAALARVKPDNPQLAERFELFYNGLELANGFSELTDENQQRERFEADNARRAERGLPVYPVDENLLAALASGLPECAGVAIGLDRLLMVLLDLESIDQALSFIDH